MTALGAPGEREDRTTKRKVSLSLDADLVAELEQAGPLSSQVNAILAADQQRRRQRMALDELIDELVDKYGPLDSPEDLDAIARYQDMLS